MLSPRKLAAFAVLACSLCPGLARGDDYLPSPGRLVYGPINSRPSGNGLEIEVVWTAAVPGPSATFRDYSTDIHVRVGDYSATQTVRVSANPGAGFCPNGKFGDPCGRGTVDGQDVPLLNLSEDGGYSQFPWITTKFPFVPKDMYGENDLIEVTLTPTPGSEPELDTSDDFVAQPVGGPIFYDRSFRSVELEPIPGTTDLYDIVVEYQLAYNTVMPALDIRTDIVMNLNGQNMVFQPWCGQWLIIPSSICGQACSNETCAMIKCDGQVVTTLTCQSYENAWGQFGCACVSGAIRYIIPSIQLKDSDRLELALVAAPGAMPELQGLDQDSVVVCSDQAESLPYGKGKAGTNGVPTLDSTALPVLGQVSGILMKEALPGARSILFYGFQPLDVPFDGGRLLVNPAGLFVVPTPVAADGTLTLERFLPANPSLCGISLFYQLMFRDPGVATGRLAMTNGVERVLGF